MKSKSLILLPFLFFGIFISGRAQLSDYEIKILERNNLLKIQQDLKKVSDFRYGYAYVVDKKGKTNYINEKGEFVYPNVELVDFSGNNYIQKYFTFKTSSNKMGLIDSNGNILLDSIYDYIVFHQYNYISLYKAKKTALLDSKLNKIFDFQYDGISKILNDSLVVVHMRNIDGQLNLLSIANTRTNKLILPLDTYNGINLFSNWRVITFLDPYVSIFDLSGRIIIPYGKYLRLNREEKGKYLHGVTVNGHNVIDSNGIEIIKAGQYDEIWGFNSEENLFIARKGSLWGAIDSNNSIKIPFQYDMLEGFTEGITRASKDNKTFFLSKKNYVLGSYKYDLFNGYRMYKNNDTIGCVDLSGQTFPYPEYKLFPNMRVDKPIKVVITRNNRWGIVDEKFRLIVDTTFDKMLTTTAYGNFIVIVRKSKYGVIDYKGNIPIPINNDEIQRIGDYEFLIRNGRKQKIVNLKKEMIK